MRMIGTIADSQQAQRFGDYLLTLGMANDVEPGSGGFAVWVHDDDHLDRAKAELAAFLANPQDLRYAGVDRNAARIRTAQDRKTERLRRNYTDVRTRWSQPRQWNIPVTLGLIFISIIAALFTSLGSPKEGSPAEVVERRMKLSERPAFYAPKYEAVDPSLRQILPEIRRGEIWRLFTPIFLHFGIIHLLFNMLWLRDLGGLIERQKGTAALLAVVIFSALVSNLAQYFIPSLKLLSEGVAVGNFGGMSGVVYALFGYVWVKGKLQPHQGVYASESTVIIMFGWLLITLVFPMSGIANTAHVAGLLSGAFVAGAAWVLRRRA